MKVILGQRFNIIKKIATTRFSTIYLGQDMKSQNYVALKLESFNSDFPQLDIEYNFLQRFQKVVGFPKLYHYGYESDYRLLVIEYFEYSLQDLFEKCHHKFSLKTVLMIADQIISRLEYIHKYDQIHRDIKPENFMFNEKEGIIYAIDFGFFKKSVQSRSLNQTSHSKLRKKSFTGTLRYASINALNGKEQYKRDDLESLAYMLIFLLKGNLPWSEKSIKNLSKLQCRTPKLEDTPTIIDAVIENNFMTKEEAELLSKNRVTPIKHPLNSQLHRNYFLSNTPTNLICQKSNLSSKTTPICTISSASRNTSNSSSTNISKPNSIFLSSLPTPANSKIKDESICSSGISDRTKILSIKKDITPENLCHNIPEEFCIFLKSVRALKPNEIPKYEQYRKLFRDLFIRHGYLYDGKYDWNFMYEESKSLPSIKTKKVPFSRPITRLPSPRSGDDLNSSTIKKHKKKHFPDLHNNRLYYDSLHLKDHSKCTNVESIVNSNENNDDIDFDPEMQSIDMDDDINTQSNAHQKKNKETKSKTSYSSPRTNILTNSKTRGKYKRG